MKGKIAKIGGKIMKLWKPGKKDFE